MILLLLEIWNQTIANAINKLLKKPQKNSDLEYFFLISISKTELHF